MQFAKKLSLVFIALQLPRALAWSCVSLAQLSCEAREIPENSWEKECINIDSLDWTNPTTRNKTECFCSDKGKAILKRFFDCFYTRASQCPNRSDNFATSYMIWIEESCYHRGKRRFYCNDDWKPTPPWDDIDNGDMKRRYELTDPYQYSLDSERTARGVPWHGCNPDNFRLRLGEGWP
ncbi:uncharacterized protein EKO05_0010938 [Ascochyta rabiei]|uniref:Uncharacterized protein n=1 Tax=Didymella rabiei TaxID=5454 RepID=A0A162ZER1_DIDRA|nr:uncharacterized protein EKO05_0010938 [Ascochyta rabiei]KZM20569.1 hypothetical protein ST47_g8263 [Ascochyta rabiei]UPX20713.1 hypothetical protein EKO05_0010938 [Ascochyta rabiei]